MDVLKRNLIDALQSNRTYRHHRIYEVNSQIVAKAFYTQKTAEHELFFTKILHEKGVNVPEPYGLIYCDSAFEYWSLNWYFLMQKIEGKPIPHLQKKEQKKALQQFRHAIKKVLNLQIFPMDYDWAENSLYSPLEEKLYLIDFAEWSYDKGYRLKHLRKEIQKEKLVFRTHGQDIEIFINQ
ncbi:MAG: hypothetical protein U9Q69_05680 [Nanoarchaeota archaeon]|nr:hypothetical protein [Nanoarchaeota archaeon]